MRRYIFKMIAFKMNELAALKAFQMEMVVALFTARILITGALALAQDILSDKVLFAELFKIAVNGGFADLLGFQCVGYAVGGKMTVGVLFYIFEYQLTLTGVVWHSDPSVKLRM